MIKGDYNSVLEEIKRVNKLLRDTTDYHTYKQNKKYLDKLEKELRQCRKE